MSETLKIILMIFVFIGALLLAMRISGWKMKEACDAVILDLKNQNAFDPASAVELPYADGQLVTITLRDYRPKALAELINQDEVRMLNGGLYYLHKSHRPGAANDGVAI
jgi:hypothetical protein